MTPRSDGAIPDIDQDLRREMRSGTLSRERPMAHDVNSRTDRMYEAFERLRITDGAQYRKDDLNVEAG